MDEDERWAPWATHAAVESAFTTAARNNAATSSTSLRAAAASPPAAPDARRPPTRAAAPGASTSAATTAAPTPPPVATGASASLAEAGNASTLAFDELWAGPRGAWDIAAMRRGIVTSLPATSPTATRSPSTAHSHISTKLSQDRLSDLLGGPSLDGATSISRSSRASHAHVPRTKALERSDATGPPLVVRARTSHIKCEVPMWLPDSNGTVAVMGAPSAP
jgi:hypothetical protein